MKKSRIAVLFVLAFAAVMCCACTQQSSSVSSPASSSSAASSSSSAAASSASESSAALSAAMTEAVHVMILDGPSGIGMAKLTQDSSYDVRLAATADEVATAVSNGSVDIAAVPTNVAAQLYNKTQGAVQLLAVDAKGALFLLQNGEGVSTFADLAGKHVYAVGAGESPQYVFEYLLWQAGVEPGMAMDIEYLSDLSNLMELVASGKAELTLLPEPLASAVQSAYGNMRVAINVGDEWRNVTGSELVMGCIIVRSDYANEHPEAVKQFLDDLASSVAFVADDADAAARLCVDSGIMLNMATAKAVIADSSLTCLTDSEARSSVEPFLTALLQANPKSVGGSLPADDFYYVEKSQ